MLAQSFEALRPALGHAGKRAFRTDPCGDDANV